MEKLENYEIVLGHVKKHCLEDNYLLGCDTR
jgi:hypothetical protein